MKITIENGIPNFIIYKDDKNLFCNFMIPKIKASDV